MALSRASLDCGAKMVGAVHTSSDIDPEEPTKIHLRMDPSSLAKFVLERRCRSGDYMNVNPRGRECGLGVRGRMNNNKNVLNRCVGRWKCGCPRQHMRACHESTGLRPAS